MQQTRSIIIGAGEIGRSLGIVLKDYEPTFYDIRDQFTVSGSSFGETAGPLYLHICIPYSKDFIKEVKKYQKKYAPAYTVIHSTVPVGTSRKCGAVHSPVIGLHPFLVEGIKTFTKYLGGEQSSEVADYFRRAGIKVYLYDKSETTELMKILDTTFYAVCIEYTKDVKRQCEKFGVPFEAWTLHTANYNEGYTKLGYPEFSRPNLAPIMRKQGGHCTIPNCDLITTPFTEFVKKLNEK